MTLQVLPRRMFDCQDSSWRRNCPQVAMFLMFRRRRLTASIGFSRLLKNAPAYRQAGICGVPLVLRRCSVHPSTPHSSGLRGPCICLPARSRFGEGRGIFDQPGKKSFNRPLSSYIELYKTKLGVKAKVLRNFMI